MKTIKFRGRCAFSGAWRYGFYYSSKGNHIIRDENDIESIVLEKSVGEFTGVHDNKGKEIFEGDILKDHVGRIITIEWHNVVSSFCLVFDDSFRHYFGEAYSPNQLEIIGNIFENLDLIKL